MVVRILIFLICVALGYPISEYGKALPNDSDLYLILSWGVVPFLFVWLPLFLFLSSSTNKS